MQNLHFKCHTMLPLNCEYHLAWINDNSQIIAHGINRFLRRKWFQNSQKYSIKRKNNVLKNNIC